MLPIALNLKIDLHSHLFSQKNNSNRVEPIVLSGPIPIPMFINIRPTAHADVLFVFLKLLFIPHFVFPARETNIVIINKLLNSLKCFSLSTIA